MVESVLFNISDYRTYQTEKGSDASHGQLTLLRPFFL